MSSRRKQHKADEMQSKQTTPWFRWMRGMVTFAGIVGMMAMSADAWAGQQLLFQVKTNNGPNKVYQFFAVTEGPSRRLVGLRYFRKTLRRVKIWKKLGGRKTLVPAKRWVVDLCYPQYITFGQIKRGLPIFRKSPKAHMSRSLKQLVALRDQGRLTTSQRLQLQRETALYCRDLRRKSHKGRFINSIRGYGYTKGTQLDPIRGGHIVVTYLRNGLLNFFRGNYRYVVLKIRKKSGRWALSTTQGHDANKLFFRAFSLGVSAIKRGFRRGAPAIPSRPCHRWIDRQRGTCKLSVIQRKRLPRG